MNHTKKPYSCNQESHRIQKYIDHICLQWSNQKYIHKLLHYHRLCSLILPHYTHILWKVQHKRSRKNVHSLIKYESYLCNLDIQSTHLNNFHIFLQNILENICHISHHQNQHYKCIWQWNHIQRKWTHQDYNHILNHHDLDLAKSHITLSLNKPLQSG